jgi:hypothetical protein
VARYHSVRLRTLTSAAVRRHLSSDGQTSQARESSIRKHAGTEVQRAVLLRALGRAIFRRDAAGVRWTITFLVNGLVEGQGPMFGASIA